MKKCMIMTAVLLLLLLAPAMADQVIPANAKHERPVIEGIGSDGFMASDHDEFVMADEAAGLWLYVSASLRVEIDRYTAENMALRWYTAHVWEKGGTGMRTWLADPNKPYEERMYVESIARKYNVVFALNGDFFEDRVGNMPVGLIIRSGKVINARAAASRSEIPTLDILGLFNDGTMKCFGARSHTAEEYLEMGVTDTLCFGPILISGGVIDTAKVIDYGHAREPRTALGMVEKGHYVAILAEGRTEESIAIQHIEMARMLLEEGCVEALNLDGGQTSVMSFMGIKINKTGQYGKGSEPRLVTDIIGIGTSELATGSDI